MQSRHRILMAREGSEDEINSDNDPLLGEEAEVKVKLTKRNQRPIRWVACTFLLFGVAVVALTLVLILVFMPRDQGIPRSLPYSVTRTYSKAAVATDAEQCSTIGRQFLEQGGSVVDAAIGTLLCLGIHNAHSCGIGGGFFITIYATPRNGTKKELVTLDSREMAPGAATEDMFSDGTSSLKGGKSIAVPAELKGYWEAWQRYGRLPWRELFQPAIKLCKLGYVIDPALGNRLQKMKSSILNTPGLREVFTDAYDRVKKPGDIAYRPRLAHTLEIISQRGPDALYEGIYNSNLMADLKDAGSIVTKEDLEQYKPIWRTPAKSKVESLNLDVASLPPPSSGAIIQYIFHILEGYKWSNNTFKNDGERTTAYHRLAEAFKFAYAQRSYLGDPDFVEDANSVVDRMLSKKFTEKTRSRIDDQTTHDVPWYNSAFRQLEDHGTCHMSMVAADGGAVAATSTINYILGSGVRGSRTGIIFNDQMDDFDKPGTHSEDGYSASTANLIRPHKRPLSSMSPTIMLDQFGNVRVVTGASGGSKIPTAVSFVMFHHLWLGLGINNATDLPRLHHTLLPNVLQYEDGMGKTILESLAHRNHKTRKFSSYAVVQSIVRKCVDEHCAESELIAVSDKRKAGVPDGY